MRGAIVALLILIVLLLVAILAALLYQNRETPLERFMNDAPDSMQEAVDKARSGEPRAEVKTRLARVKATTIGKAVSLYLLDEGLSHAPEGFDLNVLRRSSEDGGGYNGPYLEEDEDLIDPWGNPYVFLVPGEVNSWFDVVSYGTDGLPGGEGEAADITQ